MLAKAGDLTLTKNWRPIAVLRVLYKVFARMVYNRIQPVLDKHQPPEQCAFRPGYRIEEALLTVDLLVSRATEFSMPVWAASLDMRKAFDRVEHEPLIDALRQHGLKNGYINLIQLLYSGQTGQVGYSAVFSITREVRQGDVLSTILFNAVLESAFSKWRSQISTDG